MASVTFPPALGGDGSTVTDDASPPTGLANGGHRSRFVAALSQAVAVMSGAVSQVVASAAAALSSQNAAAASAATALSAPGTNATSTTSLTISTGAKTWTIQTGKSIVPGMQVMVANTASPATQYMRGTVTAYNSGTGQLDVSVDYTLGSGTIATWTVSLTGAMDITRAPLNSPALTGTPTAPTTATSDSSTKLATTALVDAKILSGPGTGGQVITGSITLTASTMGAISVVPAQQGLGATAPVATGCLEGVPLISIDNKGDFDYAFRDASGTLIGYVRPRTCGLFGLADNTTSAGVWTSANVEKVGATASLSLPTLANMTSGGYVIPIDANRNFVLFGGTDLYGIVHDSSLLPGNPWGSAVLIRATIGSFQYQGVLSAANQILVTSCSATTAFEAITLTIAGVGITPNTGTKATAVLAGNISGFGQFIAFGTGFILGYSRATTTCAVRQITVSGTTPTIGGEQTVLTSVAATPAIYISGSTARCVGASATQLVCQPFTASGATLTPGTVASATTTDQTIRSWVNGNGNICVFYVNGTSQFSVFKLTGSVEAVTTAAAISSVSGMSLAASDYQPISAGKTAIIAIASNAVYFNILTDSSGTASAGTTASMSFGGSPSTCQALGANGTNANFGVRGNAGSQRYTVDCSGSSPLISSFMVAGSSNPTGSAGFTSADKYGNRSPVSLQAGSIYANVSGSADAQDSLWFSNGQAYRPKVTIAGVLNALGNANNVSYAIACSTNNSVGINITKVELSA